MATILSVDDRAINREFLATLLTYAGHAVVSAGNGIEALAALRAQPIDLVITDILMPGMDGVELAERMRDDAAIAHVPIIFYTATYRATEARALGESCGVHSVLSKPAEPQEILDAVMQALGGTPPQTATGPAPSRSQQSLARLPTHVRHLTELHALLVGQQPATAGEAAGSQAVAHAFHSLSLRLAASLELDLVLASERDPQQMLGLFCAATQDIVSCRYAGVAVVDASGTRLDRYATRGLSDELHARFAGIDPRIGVLGHAVASGRPQRASADPPETLGLPEFHPPVSSLLVVAVPVRSAISISGWLYLADKTDGSAFSDEDEQFAVTLAAQFALAYGNLTLYDEIQRHAAKLEIEVMERRRAQAELAYRATHDQVTDLPRFLLIEEQLQGAFERAATAGGRIVVAYVDIDRFHTINETRGRAVGDEVLREIARRLLQAGGENGRVAHIAADEFAVVCFGSDAAQRALAIGDGIRRRIQEPVAIEGAPVYLSCSVGVSCFPDNGSGAQELLRQAEEAMKRAKQEGRNAVRAFSNEQKQELADRLSVGLRLNDAIRNGELVVHYQPLISGRDWKIAGFEALVRWQHPELGLLAPGRFLPIAEDLGLILDIDRQVLDLVCRQAREWIERGAGEFFISVNVSTQDLERPDFVERVRRALAEQRVPPSCLELELTEGMTTGNIERLIDTMRAFKALGVTIALDDFGTGYSSLNYLRQLPIDKLKIDKSFVHEISSDAGAAGICRAVIALGHQIGMKVLAEGVETAAQVGYLRRNDCDEFQGYYFSKPVPGDAALELLRMRYVPHEGLDQEQEPRTLLLVDDEENVLRALIRTLRRDGYRILTASTVDEALDVLARNDVHVIVSDQRMPGTSGTEFLGRVKDMYPDTVRMILSGYSDLGTVTDAVNRGAVYKFLTKPWSDAELRSHIHKAFRLAKLSRARADDGSVPPGDDGDASAR
jgi:diguanylate cyclase (GGDEF)-like protein